MKSLKCENDNFWFVITLLIIIIVLFLPSCKTSEDILSLRTGETLAIRNEQAASNKLLDILKATGYPTDDTAMMLEEHDDWKDGEKAWFFAWGKNVSEKFTVEERFAVTETGAVWKYDILADGWALLQ